LEKMLAGEALRWSGLVLTASMMMGLGGDAMKSQQMTCVEVPAKGGD
jgi:hypothetical protein